MRMVTGYEWMTFFYGNEKTMKECWIDCFENRIAKKELYKLTDAECEDLKRTVTRLKNEP